MEAGRGIMECSNCREVLESGCGVSAGLRQEDRLILDWEKRHKGRSCSGAPGPFGKLFFLKKKKKAQGGCLSIFLLCLRLEIISGGGSYPVFVLCVQQLAAFRPANVEIFGTTVTFFSYRSTFSSPWCLLAGIIMKEDASKLHPPTPPFTAIPSPSRRCLSPRCFFALVCCCASIVSLRGGDPVSAGCISGPALYSGVGGGVRFRLSKHLRATAFRANATRAISPFLSLRH